MNNYEDEQIETKKKINKFFQNYNNLFEDFETLNNEKTKKIKKKKKEKLKEQIVKENNYQQIQNNQLNNFLNNQTYQN